jgi:uncharacterized membrane protein
MPTTRIEAFSDGVFAIAITLLALEIGVPEVGDGDLAHALAEQWPAYASYAVSFATIGIIWMNHHAVFAHLRRIDRGLVLLNLLLLAWVALIPWPTSLIAEYMREGGADERVAALVYTGAMTGMGLSFGALWTYATRRRRLVGSSLTDDEIRYRTARFTIGGPLYALTMGVALVSAPASLVLTALLAVYYVLPAGGAVSHPSEPAG